MHVSLLPAQRGPRVVLGCATRAVTYVRVRFRVFVFVFGFRVACPLRVTHLFQFAYGRLVPMYGVMGLRFLAVRRCPGVVIFLLSHRLSPIQGERLDRFRFRYAPVLVFTHTLLHHIVSFSVYGHQVDRFGWFLVGPMPPLLPHF